jgi:hypothetical protein
MHVESTSMVAITSTPDKGHSDLMLAGTGVGPVYSSTPAPGSTIDFGNVILGNSASLSLDIPISPRIATGGMPT